MGAIQFTFLISVLVLLTLSAGVVGVVMGMIASSGDDDAQDH
ncbi:hypothetical protein ACWDTI_12270 [Gordonia sp. NPDC003424]